MKHGLFKHTSYRIWKYIICICPSTSEIFYEFNDCKYRDCSFSNKESHLFNVIFKYENRVGGILRFVKDIELMDRLGDASLAATYPNVLAYLYKGRMLPTL